jgi:PilZ domain
MADEPSAPVPAEAPAQKPARSEATASGRYIPYSGGSAGWFENSGVLKYERHNNYQFHREMDLPEVRSKQFERWGPAFDRRQGDRRRRELPINVLREGKATGLTTWDINNRGIRLQLASEPAFGKGDSVSVELLDAPGGKALTLLDAQVVWFEQVGTTRAVWNVGLYFPYVSPESGTILTQLIGE